jgi:hypothetical protein
MNKYLRNRPLATMAHFYTACGDMCALRGWKPLTPECQGLLPSLRSEQGAGLLAALRTYPYKIKVQIFT